MPRMEACHAPQSRPLLADRCWPGFTAERNAAAWERLYIDLSTAIKGRPRRIVMVFGVQGAGKSTWTKKCLSEPDDTVYVDSTFATATRRSVNCRWIGRLQPAVDSTGR